MFSDALLELQVEKEALGGGVAEFIVVRKKRIGNGSHRTGG